MSFSASSPLRGSPTPEELADLGLSYGGIPLTIWTEPWYPAPGQILRLRQAIAAFYRAALRVTESVVTDPRLAALFGYSALQHRFIAIEPGYRPVLPLGRIDLYLEDDRIALLEFNTDGAAGWHWTTELERISRRQGRLPESSVAPLATRLLHTLLDCYRQWASSTGSEPRPQPRLAIIDWAGVSTAAEQRGLARHFSSLGYPCSCEEPRELVYRDGRLYGCAGPIDVIYRRLVSEEVFAAPEAAAALLAAYQDRAVCMVGGFRTDPAWSKTLHAVLASPDFQSTLSPTDQAWIRATVPWTVAVNDGEVYSRETCATALRSELLATPERYVIKPARGYAGRAVSAGAWVAAEAWETAVATLFDGGTWVVQHRATPALYPGPHDDGYRFFQLGAFTLNDQVAALVGRCSRTPVLTATNPEVWLPVAAETDDAVSPAAP